MEGKSARGILTGISRSTVTPGWVTKFTLFMYSKPLQN